MSLQKIAASRRRSDRTPPFFTIATHLYEHRVEYSSPPAGAEALELDFFPNRPHPTRAGKIFIAASRRQKADTARMLRPPTPYRSGGVDYDGALEPAESRQED
jgi:hypothetical protein